MKTQTEDRQEDHDFFDDLAILALRVIAGIVAGVALICFLILLTGFFKSVVFPALGGLW